MRGCPDVIEAGGVYLLDDLSYAQVTAVTAGRIRFRRRAGVSCLGWIAARRGLRPDAFRRRVVAEVDAAFFPDFAVAGATRSRPQPDTAATLRGRLDDMARRRPFRAAEPDPP